MGSRIIVSTGDKYGKLTIVDEVDPLIRINGKTRRTFLCVCECGRTTEVQLEAMRSGNTESCGCHKLMVLVKRSVTHGLRSHELYSVWASMKSRCLNENELAFKNYGARGIVICDEWINDFKEFFEWATSHGWEPGLQIDRIDNNKGYSPSNCHFTTNMRNSRNRRDNHMLTAFGKTLCLADWADEVGIKYKTLRSRLDRGWNPELALLSGVTHGKPR